MTGEGTRPPPPTILWVVLRAHWIAGLLPLFALTEISRPGLAAATAAFLLGALFDRSGMKRPAWNRLATPLALGTVLAAAADLYAGSRDLLSAVTLLVLGLQSVKFLLPKTTRDGWQLCAISFLEFLASAASTTHLQFALFLFLFLWLSVGAMWTLHLEEESASRDTAPEIRTGLAIRLLTLSSTAGFLMTALLFVVIPRVGVGHLLRHLDRSAGLPGFSDTITLGGVTSVKADRRVAARVEFPLLAPGIDPTTLYLKGAVYPRFDGTRWTRQEERQTSVPRSGIFYITAPAPPGTVLSTAEISLEPAGHATLFVYGEPVTLEGRLGPLQVDRSGSYRFRSPVTTAVRYRVLFAKPGSTPRRSAPPPEPGTVEIPADLPKVRELSARIAGGARTPREKAERFLRYFRSEYRYTLSDPAPTVKDFLFVRKAGFCEHYATGLALLLRSAGIPARVAAGYLGGEWSDLGDYLIVRQSDAHAWTEAFLDGRWVTLDATPPAEGISPFSARTGMIGLYLDWARQRWNRYVVNYSLRMQAEAVSEGWRAVRRSPWNLKELFRGARLPRRDLAPLLGLIAGSAALLAWILTNRLRTRRRPDRIFPNPLPRSYARLLCTLSAKGFRGSPGTTLEEMVRRAVAGTPDLEEPARRFLCLYHLDRFGPAPLPAKNTREAARLAEALRRGLSAGPGAA